MASAVNITVQTILGIAGVTALVSTRVEPYVIPAGALPAIGVTLVSRSEQVMITGLSGHQSFRVSLHCLAGTATGAEALMRAVETGLRDFAGTRTISGSTYGVRFFPAGAYTDYAEDRSTFRHVLDYVLQVQR